MKSVTIILLLLLSSFAVAEVVEDWICKDSTSYEWNTIVKASVFKGRASGLIQVAGMEHNSAFEVLGFNRRWDFGLTEEGTYDYAFIMKPNGDAAYYDFSSTEAGETVTPSQFLECKSY